MLDINPISSQKKLQKRALPLLFFLFYFLSVYLTVNSALLYHGGSTITNFPVFLTSNEFLIEHLTNTAGPAKYFYAFIAQFFNFNALGSLIITTQALVIFLSLNFILKRLNTSIPSSINYLPPLAILFLYNHYTFHFAAFNTIAIVLVLFCIYLRLPSKIKPLAPLLISPIIYYLIGPTLLYLAVLCIVYELVFSKKLINAILYACIAAIIPYSLGMLVFELNIIDSYCDMLPFSWKITTFADRSKMLNLVYLLYIFPVVIIAISAIFNTELKKTPDKTSLSTGKTFYKTIALLLILTAALVTTTLAYDKKQKAFFAVDYYSYHKNWKKVLKYAHHLPNNYSAVHHATRALYHSGKLNEKMFEYTQHPDALLFTDNKTLDTNLTTFDIYIDLGIINLAEHYLSRSLTHLGAREIFLQRLAWINMVKGNIETAKTFLNSLSKTLFYKKWANEQLEALKNDPSLANNAEIQSVRKNMLRDDRSMSKMKQEDFLKSLLKANPKNKMAFDYLMAWYIITKNTNKFTASLGQFQNYGYKQLPDIYQQAILMHTYSTKKDVNLMGFKISSETMQNAKQFYAVMNQYIGNEQLQLKILNEKYGKTYLYYFVRKFNRMPKFSGRLK